MIEYDGGIEEWCVSSTRNHIDNGRCFNMKIVVEKCNLLVLLLAMQGTGEASGFVWRVGGGGSRNGRGRERGIRIGEREMFEWEEHRGRVIGDRNEARG